MTSATARNNVISVLGSNAARETAPNSRCRPLHPTCRTAPTNRRSMAKSALPTLPVTTRGPQDPQRAACPRPGDATVPGPANSATRVTRSSCHRAAASRTAASNADAAAAFAGLAASATPPVGATSASAPPHGPPGPASSTQRSAPRARPPDKTWRPPASPKTSALGPASAAADQMPVALTLQLADPFRPTTRPLLPTNPPGSSCWPNDRCPAVRQPPRPSCPKTVADAAATETAMMWPSTVPRETVSWNGRVALPHHRPKDPRTALATLPPPHLEPLAPRVPLSNPTAAQDKPDTSRTTTSGPRPERNPTEHAVHIENTLVSRMPPPVPQLQQDVTGNVTNRPMLLSRALRVRNLARSTPRGLTNCCASSNWPCIRNMRETNNTGRSINRRMTQLTNDFGPTSLKCNYATKPRKANTVCNNIAYNQHSNLAPARVKTNTSEESNNN